MSDTFNNLVTFISEDPLMLGLCIAVIVLIIIFIIVLCTGEKKKDQKSDSESKVEENTTQLLAADLNDEPLMSTQDFNLSQMKMESSTDDLEKTINVPDVESFEEEMAEKDAPISIDEVISLKTSREENDLKDTIQIPVINEEPMVALEVPNNPIIPEVSDVENIEIPISNVETVSNETPELTPVVEEPELDMVLPSKETNETPRSSVSEGTGIQPFSSVYVNSGDELPKMTEDFSKTAIIKHVPVIEEEPVLSEPQVDLPTQEQVTPVMETKSVEEDISLPKLNRDEHTSVLSSLTGESFNINKN